MTEEEMRALDEFLATKVMGWHEWVNTSSGEAFWMDSQGAVVDNKYYWHPTDDDNDALQVAEAMRQKHFAVTLWLHPSFKEGHWKTGEPLEGERYGCHVEGKTEDTLSTIMRANHRDPIVEVWADTLGMVLPRKDWRQGRRWQRKEAKDGLGNT